MVFHDFYLYRIAILDIIIPKEYFLHYGEPLSTSLTVYDHIYLCPSDSRRSIIPKGYLHYVLLSKASMAYHHHRFCRFNNLDIIIPKVYHHRGIQSTSLTVYRHHRFYLFGSRHNIIP